MNAHSAPPSSPPPPAWRAWLVWGLGALFYLIGFYLRVAPAVITDQLMADFQMGAASLGNLSAFYYYSYVAMQVPTGALADSWGPRKLLTSGAVVAALGTLVFGLAPTLFWANFSRLLIGGSVAVAFVAMLKLAAHWFPHRLFALISGMALFSGLVGAVSAGVPLRALVEWFGWRPVMVGSAGFTFLVAGLTWVFVRDDPAEIGYTGYAPTGSRTLEDSSRPGIRAGFREIFRYRNTWLLVAAPSGVVGPVLAFSGLWGVPFLTTHYHLAPARAAALTSTLLVAWAVAGPLLGALSDRIGKRKPIYVVGSSLSLLGWIFILMVPNLSLPLLVGLLLITGFASGCMIIGFAFAKESVPSAYAGTVSGITNMGVMIGPMVLQPAIGWMLDQNWNGAMIRGARIYDLAAYRKGFWLILAWSLLASILVLFTRETNCRQQG
ncbi:MAG: MFS transporter [Deltaproteobacteria bacterium]|nr:MFS transporter [Deltaproteobacteria bacterium]